MAQTEMNLDVRKRWRPPWYAYVLVALALAVVCSWFYPDFRAWQLEREIAASVPPGSSDAQVDAWLKGKSIPHSEVKQGEKEYTMYVSSYSTVGLIPASGYDRIIYGRIYHAHPLLQIDIVIEFFFDKDGKLISHDVRQELTFL